MKKKVLIAVFGLSIALSVVSLNFSNVEAQVITNDNDLPPSTCTGGRKVCTVNGKVNHP